MSASSAELDAVVADAVEGLDDVAKGMEQLADNLAVIVSNGKQIDAMAGLWSSLHTAIGDHSAAEAAMQIDRR